METNLKLNRLDFFRPQFVNARLAVSEAHLVFGLLLLLWMFMPRLISWFDARAGAVDPSIWLLILLSVIAFLLVVALSWWLLHGFWLRMGLPAIGMMVLQFKSLELWQQLGFYWLSFALLLLGSILCLVAIC